MEQHAQQPQSDEQPRPGAITNDGQWGWDGQRWQPRPVSVTLQPYFVAAPMAVSPVMPKTKSTAVLLAVFLGFWTWLYTYKTDAAFFWINLVLGLLTSGAWWILVSWPWAIIHSATRSDAFYAGFPYGR